jgi:hypothetical protein
MENTKTKMEIGATYQKDGKKATIIGEGTIGSGWGAWFIEVEKLYERTQLNADMGHITSEQLSGTEPYVWTKNVVGYIKSNFNWDKLRF